MHARVEGLPRRRVDLAFTRWRVAVLVDGCFWHGCPDHGTLPSSNREWWVWKLALNATRDADTDVRLERLGWVVVRIWEHVPAVEAADRVEETLAGRGAPVSTPSARAPESRPEIERQFDQEGVSPAVPTGASAKLVP